MPVSDVPALKCPHCGHIARFTHRWSTATSDDLFDFRQGVGCFTCSQCQLPIAVIFTDGTDTRKIAESWPKAAWGQDFPDVPEHLASAASEAHVCLSAGSPRGSVALARSVLEAVAKDKGITRGNLQSKIDGLYEARQISEAMRDAAHEIRFAGNEAAHGDLVAEQLAIEDAEEIVALMDTILERVFQEPVQAARIREKRERRNPGNRSLPSPAFSDEPPF